MIRTRKTIQKLHQETTKIALVKLKEVEQKIDQIIENFTKDFEAGEVTIGDSCKIPLALTNRQTVLLNIFHKSMEVKIEMYAKLTRICTMNKSNDEKAALFAGLIQETKTKNEVLQKKINK